MRRIIQASILTLIAVLHARAAGAAPPVPIEIVETIENADVVYLGSMDGGAASRRLGFYSPQSEKSNLPPELKHFEYILSDTFFTICRDGDAIILSFLAHPTGDWAFPENTTIRVRRENESWVARRVFVSRYTEDGRFLSPIIEDLGQAAARPLAPNPTSMQMHYEAVGLSAFNGSLHAEFDDTQVIQFYAVIPRKSANGKTWEKKREPFLLELVQKEGGS